MKTPTEIPFMWSKSSPLASLSGLVLLIGATSRLSYALAVSASVLFVYAFAPLLVRLLSPLIPTAHRSWIRVVTVSTVAAIFCRFAGIAWPVLIHELSPYLGMVALSLLSSELMDRTEDENAVRTLQIAVSEAFMLCALALSLSVVREAFGFGTLSVPSAEGISILFSQEQASALALRSVSAASGGFIILAYVIAAYRKARFRRFGAPLCGEDEV